MYVVTSDLRVLRPLLLNFAISTLIHVDAGFLLSSMAFVPNELVGSILDELYRDYSSLRMCSLVSTSFCSPSQRHLFHSIWLHRRDWDSYTSTQREPHRGISIPAGTIMASHSLLMGSPHIASYVHELALDLPTSEDEDITLKHVLRTLPNLERLVISGMTVRWSDLSMGLRSAILAILEQPSLDRLHLLNIREVPAADFLRILPSMRAVSIHRTTFRGSGSLPDMADIQPASRLEHLTISTNMHSTYKFILPHAPRLINVTTVHLFIDFFSCMGPEKLLSALGGNLRHLKVDCDRLYHPFGLPPLPMLRTLELRVSNGSRRCMPDGLADTLVALPPVPLRLVFVISDLPQELAWDDDGVIPALLDSQLHDVHCELIFRDASNTENASIRDTAFAAFRAAINRVLPGLHITFSRADELNSYVGRLL
ncbi:hypothetical protein C8R43DRAFT_1229280 [Mycena crocata]|nr:hypothetical protein C8R43DRAFT_1229280 [Mycena crocata]